MDNGSRNASYAKNQKLFRSVRTALRKRIPTANELAYDYSSFVVISYSATDHTMGSVLSIAGRPDGVQLYFSQGPELPDPKKLLMGAAKMVRFIRVESLKDLANPDVNALMDAAIDFAKIPLPAEGSGKLIIKTNKMGAAKKKSRPKAKKKK